MVSKALSRSRQPGYEPSPITEEEDNQDGGSESNSSEEKEDAHKPNLENVSDPDLGSPSSHELQPVSRKRTNQDSQSPAINEKSKSTQSNRSKKSKSAGSGRLWSDEDETTLLNGIIDYKNSTGHSFNTNLVAFYKFISGKLRAEFSKDQLANKIKRVKKRFLDVSKKSDPVFSKPHDIKMFELSKKIWGVSDCDGNGNSNNARSIKIRERSSGANKGIHIEIGEGSNNGKRVQKGKRAKKHDVEVELGEKENGNGKSVMKGESVKKHLEAELDEEEEEEDEEEGVGFRSKYLFLSSSFSNLTSNVPFMVLPESGVSSALLRLSSIGDDNAKELDDKWKQLMTEEIELSYKKLNLMKEQMRLIFDH